MTAGGVLAFVKSALCFAASMLRFLWAGSLITRSSSSDGTVQSLLRHVSARL